MGQNGQGRRNRSSNNLVVPQANAGLQQMKYEAAQELGVSIPQDGYMGHYTSRETGSLGGYITKRLVQMAEQQLSGRSNS
ncbi:alpha/beta-type small acid-soluble spore protein [Paenibacillus sp. F411]|nr:alpha/beta-type small acid-soluble spore protein [Paenibacillus sp. F411]